MFDAIQLAPINVRWQLTSFDVKRSAIRLMGGVVVTAGLVFSVNMAAAAPLESGPFECGLGECQQTSTVQATVQSAGDPYGPHLIP